MAIWRWQDGAAQPSRDPSGAARRHGGIRGAIALAVACGFLLTHHPFAAGLVAAIGSLTLLTALVSPLGAYAKLTAALDVFARGVGLVLTYALLVPIYFLIITPFGLLTRHGKSDPLRRTWTAATPTFWTDRPATSDAPERRKRPF